MHRSVLRSPAVCSLVRGGVSRGGPVAALRGQSHRLRKHTGAHSLTLLPLSLMTINQVLKSCSLSLSVSLPSPCCRRVPSADSWGRHCAAGKQAVGGATTSPVPWLQELSWTGHRDTLCVRGTHTQVSTHNRHIKMEYRMWEPVVQWLTSHCCLTISRFGFDSEGLQRSVCLCVCACMRVRV